MEDAYENIKKICDIIPFEGASQAVEIIKKSKKNPAEQLFELKIFFSKNESHFTNAAKAFINNEITNLKKLSLEKVRLLR